MNRNHHSASATCLRTRLASEADLPRLVELVNSAFSIETFLEGTRTDREDMAASLEKGSIVVAEEDGEVVATIYAEKRGGRGYLGMLAVDPAQQGKGLARRVMEAAEEHLRGQGCTALDIHVLSLRTELPPVYRRFGYVETGTEEFDYPRTFREGAECHCIVMSKDL
jgi:ribosomal protein S18 acetylase RimI-like enzyme